MDPNSTKEQNFCIDKITSLDSQVSQLTYSYIDSQYFLISLDRENCTIYVKYINTSYKIHDFFIGYSARDISNQILLKYSSHINSFHAAYLGRELMKAEISMVLNQPYIQS